MEVKKITKKPIIRENPDPKDKILEPYRDKSPKRSPEEIEIEKLLEEMNDS